MVPELTPFEKLISFTRTSAATYVNSAGNIVTTPASKNLLTWTEVFSNAAWSKNNSTITANSVAAPDGTMTADTLVEDTANAAHVVQQSATLAAVAHTFSVYLKAKERSWAQVLNGTIANGFAYFDLATGAVGTVGAGVSATAITPVGNGWYRCSIAFTASSGGNIMAVRTASANGTGLYLGDGTSGIFIWGAQLEQASAATSYTKNDGGLFPARFDYDPVTLQPRGLLIEEQRTNLLPRSEEFNNSDWSKFAGTVSANSTISPDGTADADTFIEDTSTAAHYAARAASWTAGTAYTLSVFAKETGAGAKRYLSAFFPSAAFGVQGRAAIDLATGEVVANGVTATATRFANGWWRLTITAVATATTSSATGFVISDTALNGGNISARTGDGTSGIFVWGAQLEAASFATSYIPTAGSQVTRAADQASIVAPNFAPWYNQSEGTFVVEAVTQKPTSLGATAIAIDASDGGINNRHYIGVVSASAEVRTANGGSVQSSLTQAYTANVIEKYAYAMKANDFAFARNGSMVGTDTSGSMPTIDRMFIGNAAGSTAYFNGHIRRISYYPIALHAQVQALSA